MYYDGFLASFDTHNINLIHFNTNICHILDTQDMILQWLLEKVSFPFNLNEAMLVSFHVL